MCAGVHSLMHNVKSIYVVIFHSLSLSQPLYAGVVSLCEDAEFTITFHRKDTLAAAKGKQYLVYSTCKLGEHVTSVDKQSRDYQVWYHNDRFPY